ncbi:MAG: ATP-binding protein [Pseudomonadota bacterium]
MNDTSNSVSIRLLGFIEGRRKSLVIVMLASLYVALMGDFQGSLTRALLVTHFGLFLLWQPFLSAHRKLDPPTALLLFVTGAALLLSLSGWVIVIWLALLIGITGGRVFMVRMRRQRFFYLLALLYLLILLLIWAVPRLILGQADIGENIRMLPRFGLPLLLLVLTLLKIEEEDTEASQVIDFFYSLLLFQLVILLVLGSIAMMRYTGDVYFLALLICVLGSAGGLFALAFLWSPPAGYGGMRAYLSRYLMSVGVPSELWLRQLAAIAEREESPAKFLDKTIAEVRTLPWVAGATWQAPDGAGEFGRKTEYASDFSAHTLRFTLYSNYRLSPALFLHMRLLVQLWGEFYEGKRREQALRMNAYMQAVHETGARLTHDIKNLLQSLYTLASAGQNQQVGMDEAFARMLKKQLPELTKRLQITLDKLRSPVQQEISLRAPASRWWEELKLRYEGRQVIFQDEIHESASVPIGLFDNVAENCIENARHKRLREPELEIVVTLTTQPILALRISDNGSAIPEERLAGLFNQPIEDADGMGIGLYQAFRQAEGAGFHLTVSCNAPGKVEFVLEGV